MSGSNERRKLRFAGFTIDLARLSLDLDDEPIYLRPKAFDVLRYLAENPRRVITKNELIEKIWSPVLVTDDSLVQCIKDIRDALGDASHRVISTLPRRGYMFMPEVVDGAATAESASATKVRYAKSGGVHIAYQSWGHGAVDLVFCPGFVGHIESRWSEPGMARFLRGMGEFARVVMFDKRGTGMSDRVENVPGLDERVDDMRAVMDALGIERAAIMGPSEGGSLAAYFAATHPHRCQALVLYGAFARFASWIASDEALQRLIEYIDTSWGSGGSLRSFAPSMVGNAAFEEWWARSERLGASPADAIALMRLNSQIDISDVLPTIHVPTLVIHRTDDATVDVEGGRLLAARIPGARFVELPGIDHLPWVGQNSDEILRLVGEFVTESKSAPLLDRVLAVVFVMETVAAIDSASGQASGRSGARNGLPAHDSLVRQELSRFRARQVKALGNRILAVFDAPSRSIASALAMQRALRRHGADLRVGIHIGEVERVADDVRGVAVEVATSAIEHASVGDVLVSRTVRDLVAGSGIAFEYVGAHRVAGGRDKYQLYRATA
ncbi:MAG TPA: alpha/beta fold hydrolase [Casimicrobiaceae bacterium]